MLELKIEKMSFWDEVNCEFIDIEPFVLKLEHSLISLSKWESKWHIPFINNKNKTPEQTLDYIRCMTLNKNYINPVIYRYMSKENLDKINSYIEDSMTATWFKQGSKSASVSRQVLTAELIYYYMVTYGIPFTCEKWHINRLLTLIKVCNEKDEGNNRKMSKKEIMSQNQALNAARKKRLNTRG